MSEMLMKEQCVAIINSMNDKALLEAFETLQEIKEHYETIAKVIEVIGI